MSPKFYNTLTKKIVEYPEDAAALFDVLKPVPSEKKESPKVELKAKAEEVKENNNAK